MFTRLKLGLVVATSVVITLMSGAAHAATPVTVDDSCMMAGYTPYCNITKQMPTAGRTLVNGKFCLWTRNGFGRRVSATLDSGNKRGTLIGFAAGQTRQLCIMLPTGNRVHVTLRVRTAPYTDVPAGTWTPRFSSWLTPTASNGYFKSCSHNPFQHAAVLNLGVGSNQSVRYTRSIRPGDSACVSLFLSRHSVKTITIKWAYQTSADVGEFLVGKAPVFRY